MIKRLLLIGLLLFIAGCSSEPTTDAELTTAGMESFTKQDYTKARDYFGSVISRQPSNREVLFFLGMAYSRDNLNDSAYYYLQRLNLLYPNDVEANREIYNLAIDLEDWEGAMDALNSLISAGDEPSQYWYQLSELNARVERYYNALLFKKLLLEREPENPRHYLESANLAVVVGSVGVALDIIDRATDKFGERKELLVNKGLYLAAGKRFKESEVILRKIVAQDTSFIPARLNLAHTLASQDNRSKKQEAYELYLDLKPQTGGDLSVDSMLAVLKEELSIN